MLQTAANWIVIELMDTTALLRAGTQKSRGVAKGVDVKSLDRKVGGGWRSGQIYSHARTHRSRAREREGEGEEGGEGEGEGEGEEREGRERWGVELVRSGAVEQWSRV